MKLPELILIVIAAFFILSCSSKNSQNVMDEETYNRFLETGSEVSGQAQSALLSHVSGAIKKGGTLYAVEFCNLEASGITDSLNNIYNCSISRVSAKNRNPQNALSTDTEKQLWDYFMSVNDTKMIHDTLVVAGQQAIYYKPILLGMQACLQCHGPEEAIDPDTYSKIRELYPDDKATGYRLNELRGMWKIEFEHENETTVASDQSSGILTGIFSDL